MCEVTINNQSYKAINFSKHSSRPQIRKGSFRATGRVTNSVTFNFEQDMSFLYNENPIILSSEGNINLSNINVLDLEINDDNPQIVTFYY